MRKYQVELKCTMFVMYEVEAKDEYEAEDKAWAMLNDGADHSGEASDWDTYSIVEVTNADN